VAEPAIALTSIEKDYGAEPVLRGVSLTVEAGEMASLIGRSGSGKSTLLHVIGGLDRRYRGAARVQGVDLASLDDRALSRFRSERVGFVFQAFHLLDHLSCAENVALPSHFHQTGRNVDKLARAREALDRVGLADLAARLPGQLSGGQKQRVAIARALFNRPSLLLADEPTGNLDSETGQAIIELFQALAADGLTQLVVTHEERVSRAARRVIRLEDGKVVGDERVEPPANGARAAAPESAP
jgi:putative ABC transport system ATP-binding protein